MRIRPRIVSGFSLTGVFIASFLLFLSVLFSCGKRGPSLPPLLVAPGKCLDLQVRQMGDRMVISFLLPEKNTDGSPLIEKPGIKLLHVILDPGKQDELKSLSPEEFFKKSRLAQTVPPEDVEDLQVDGRVFLEQDIFGAHGEKAEGKQFSYAVLLFDRKKKNSPLAEIVSIIAVKPMRPPKELSAQVEEEGIRLSWNSSGHDAAAETAPLFNIYRDELAPREPDQVDDPVMWKKKMRNGLIPLNGQPVSGNFYLDKSSSFGRDYLYSVREVHDPSLPYRESEDSGPIRVSPEDTFAPRAPGGLAVVTEGTKVRLFWFPNAEGDLAGYRIHKQGKEGDPFRIIASLPEYITAYTDQEVVPGERYSYFLTAFDSAEVPNESPPSEIVSEIVPSSLPLRQDQAGENE